MDLAVSQRHRHNPVDSICRKLKTIQRRNQEADSSPFHIPRFQSSSYNSPQPGLRCNLESILKKRTVRSDHPDTPAVGASASKTDGSSTTSSSSIGASAAALGMLTPKGSPGRSQGRRLTLGASGASPLVTPCPVNATYTITSTVTDRRTSFGLGQRQGWQRTCSTPAAAQSETDGYFTFGRSAPYGQPEAGETPAANPLEMDGERERRRSPTHSLLSYNLNFCTSDVSTLLDGDVGYPALVVKRLSLGDGLLSSETKKENMTEVSLICEEDLLDTIFHACDTQRRGKVYVSRIVDYLRHTTSRSSEDSGLEELCNMLDPDNKDISIDLDTYHAVMKEWIEDCRNQGDDTAENVTQESVKVPDSLAAKRSALLNMTSGSLEAFGGETTKSDLETSDLIYCVADLQFTNQKLQEEIRKLKQAMESMEDTNQKLIEENDDLKTQAKVGQQLLQKEKMLKEEVEEMKMTLSSSEESRAQASARSKQMERENQGLISKISALQEENIKVTMEMDDLQKKMGDLCDLNADLQVQIHSFDAVLREKDSVICQKNRHLEDLKAVIVEYSSVTEILRADKTKLENQMQMMQPDITSAGLSLSVAYRLNQTSLGSLQTELALAQNPLEGVERFSTSMCMASPLDETLDREVLLLMQGPTPEQQSLEFKSLIRRLRKEFQEDRYTVLSALRNHPAAHDEQEISNNQKLQVECERRRQDWAQVLEQLQQYTDSLEKELLKMASNMRRSRTEILHLSIRVQEQENQKQQLKDELDQQKTPPDSREASCQTPDVPQVEEDPDAPSLEWEEEYVIPESPSPPPSSNAQNGSPLSGSKESSGLRDGEGDAKRPEESRSGGGEEEEEEEEEKQNGSERGEEGQLDSGVEEEETPQGELARSRSDIPEASEDGPHIETTETPQPQTEAVTESSGQQEGANFPECTGPEDAHKQTVCAEQRDPAPLPPTHTSAADPVPSETSKANPVLESLPSEASPGQEEMVSPSNTPAELGETISPSPRCAEAASGESTTGEEGASTMSLNDSQKLPHQPPDSTGALESHRTSLLPVAEEEETAVDSATETVTMAGTKTESSDITTATSGVNNTPADSSDKAKDDSQVTSDPGAPDGSKPDATAGQSPPGGDRDSPLNKQKMALEKEQSTEAPEGQKVQEDSEVSAATEKEGETSVVSEDASDREDRRNSWSLSASEKEIEAEFHRLSLGFKCDMFTLDKRLRLEERSRDLAEDNVRREVSSCQGLLQALIPLCEDDGQSMEIIHRLQKNLEILIQSMVRVSSRSEMLGAIHQESRIGKAVEVMIQHVENLRRTYTKEHAELLELRETVTHSERSFGSHAMDRADDFRNKKQSGSQYYKQSSSRRVSIAVIPRSGDLSKSPDSGDMETDRLSRRPPWKGGSGQRPPLKRFVSSGAWPDSEGSRHCLDDYPHVNRFGYDTDSHSEEERREEPVVERRKSSLTELGNKLTSLIMPLKIKSHTPSPTPPKEQPGSTPSTDEPLHFATGSMASPPSFSLPNLSAWRPGLPRSLWVWAAVLLVLAGLLAILASLVLQPAADAAPVGTGDSWMTIQQLLWPYTSLRHNGQPPV
ncbi:inositol 1,4,5-triphosphate receptor associated 2 isoform X2 [Alosa alosa]|uniref:inositol 1,4,5-triphosphate receptor associated 2 isoform X2 n=1 Tax=Alosa alosa TaxID=278164 RepID=UPI0020154422|nr:inositol 1,4,5-triphosphate receptor associated 2 isoform X2 [Alosa alosa]